MKIILTILFLLGPNAMANGERPFTPKLGDWMSVYLNSMCGSDHAPAALLSFMYIPPNTLQVTVYFDDNESIKLIDGYVAIGMKCAKDATKEFGWKDVSITLKKYASADSKKHR